MYNLDTKDDISLIELLTESTIPGQDYNKYTQKNFVDLIKNKRIVTIFYSGAKEGEGGTDPNPGWRTIEPFCVGEGGGDLNGVYLRGWLLSGKSVANSKTGKSWRPKPGWRLFKVSRIRNINVGTKTFDKPEPNFNPNGDDNMSKIYAIANFDEKPKKSLDKTKKAVATMKAVAKSKTIKEALDIVLRNF